MTIRRPLRIAVLGDLDSIHTQRWLRALAARGHEMHAVSFYSPQSEVPAGITLHVLRGGSAGGEGAGGRSGAAASVLRLLPRSVLRLLHGLRYRRAGLRKLLNQIQPDVFYAHYLSEYGFYGALAGYKPYAVSAWGSDVYRDSKGVAGRLLTRFVLSRAALITASDPAMLAAVQKLGAPAKKTALVRVGALEELFFDEKPVSVNLQPGASPPTVISTRALEPLYNVGSVLDAFAKLRRRLPDARLVVAHDGSERIALESLALALDLASSVTFVGRLTPKQMRDALSAAQVYVSVPSSDSLSASTMEAMARGSFPVVSDLPSLDGVIEHGLNGLRVTPGDSDTLATAIQRALVDHDLRRRAAELNREHIEAEGRLSVQVDRLEATFYGLS